uniref:UL29 protein n=1 Tax=anatid alphaherpesvirus 1 TaxID=104388 RepID=B3F8Z3_9ALPH|nr:UL29 protein [Anatid alphaherpesvirus 1]
MEGAGKTIQLKPGPIGYIYARDVKSLNVDIISMLSARSADSDVAILPLIRGLTVEPAFVSNVAAVGGSRTTGLGGNGITMKLVPTHYFPNVFVFHGGNCISPSSAAPNLTLACESARERFGFTSYTEQADATRETTGNDICTTIGVDPEKTIIYLVITAMFKELVYMCNTYLHYGGIERIDIDNTSVIKIPIYPIQLVMPDVNRLAPEPFNSKHRSIGEGFELPRAFYNTKLNRLLHGAVLGPLAVATRVRNIESVARGAAHLSMDEAHDGSVLPADITFTAYDQIVDKSYNKSGRGQRAQQSASKENQNNDGQERRLASVMSADLALTVDTLLSAAIHEDGATSIGEWPIMSIEDTKLKQEALGAYMARCAALVCAMVFSTNSALYMSEVYDAGSPDAGKDSGQPSFYRFYQIAAPYLASNPQTDRDGRIIPETRDRQVNSVNGTGQDFGIDHLAMACGFSPQLLARILYYLERADSGQLVHKQELDIIKYVTGSMTADISCQLCNRDTRAVCSHTTLHRLRHRMPRFGMPIRGPIGVFGVVTSAYSDVDPLGNFAPYSALKKGDGEMARAVMQDTYRATAEKIMTELESMGLFDKENPLASAGLEAIVTDQQSFQATFTNIRQLIEREAEQLMRNLIDVRDYKIREGLTESSHTLSLSVDPYAIGICPVLSFLSKRSMLAVVQDLALSQCAYVFNGQQVDAKNFRNQFQPVLRRRFFDLMNGGFVSTRQSTVTLADSTLTAPDPTKSQTDTNCGEFDGELVRVTTEVIREMKIKNRVLFFGSTSNMSEAAKSRVAGLSEAYQRPDRRVDVLGGALGFALKQLHGVLFPKGMPIGDVSPNAQWFWTMLQRNQMPGKLLGPKDTELIRFVKRFSDEYAAMNYINVASTCVGDLAQFMLSNIILKYCDHRNYYINSITAIMATCRRPRDPSAVLHWIERPLADGNDVEKAAAEVLETVATRPHVWTTAYSSNNLVRAALTSRPFVVLGISISKYQGMAGSSRVFQAANWSNLTGGKGVCPLMNFDRTRRFMLACPRVAYVTVQQGGFNANARERTLAEQVRAIMKEGGVTPQATIFIAALKALGQRVQCMDRQDWLSLTDDEYLSELLDSMNTRTAEREGGWSVDAGMELAKEIEATSSTNIADEGDAVFDFGACDGDNTLNMQAGIGQKRQCVDDLFDLPPCHEKKTALSVDML